MRLSSVRDKILLEASSVSVWKGNYTNPATNRPYGTDPSPKIMVLGKFTHPTTHNPSVAGINLKRVFQRYGKKGLDALRKWIPEIFGYTDPKKQAEGETLRGDWEHQVQPPEEAAEFETLESESIERNNLLIIEIALQPRPLHGTSGVSGRYMVGRYGIPDPMVNDIFRTCYRTYLLDRLGPVIQDKLTSIDRAELFKQAKDQVKQAVAQAPTPKAAPGEPVATPEKPISPPPPEEPVTAPKDIAGPPPEEPETAPKDISGPPPEKPKTAPKEIKPPEPVFKAPELLDKKVPTAEPKIVKAIDKRIKEPSTPQEKERIAQKAKAEVQRKTGARPKEFPEEEFEELTPEKTEETGEVEL